MAGPFRKIIQKCKNFVFELVLMVSKKMCCTSGIFFRGLYPLLSAFFLYYAFIQKDNYKIVIKPHDSQNQTIKIFFSSILS